MIIEIQYKDKLNWKSVSGKEIDWTNYSKKYKKERIQPYYIAPEIITDVWNGEENDIQHLSWTSYYFEIFIKESEIDFLRQLKSCSNINIIQYSDDLGSIINKSYENIDLIKADLFEIQEPERASDTSGWKVAIIFRTERTIINKALPVNNTNNISFNGTLYYSDYDVLAWNKDTDSVDVDWFDNTIKRAQTTNKEGFEYVQYILSEDHDNFISNLKSTNIISINGTSITEVEYEKILIAIDLYKIIVRGVTNTTVTTDYLNTNQDYNIIVNGNTYYTDFATELIPESPVINTQNNQTGINSSSKAISKTIRQMKFHLNEVDAFALKQDFELYGQSAVINPGSINVLENREVTPNRLGNELYEIVVNCLTESTIN
jgi:hypothetical protein